MWTNDKSFSECLTAIPYCDFLLRNETEGLIGFRYDRETMEHPAIWLIVNGNEESYIVKKISEQYGVSVYENKVLIHAFFRKIKQKKSDFEKLWKSLEKYYSADVRTKVLEQLFTDSEKESDFIKHLNQNVLEQFYISEKRYYKKYSTRAFKKIQNLPTALITNPEKICKSFITKLTGLAEENHIKLISEKSVYDHVFILKENSEVWAAKNLWIFIDSENQLIDICNCYVYVYFSFEEYVHALCWIKSFWSENFNEQRKNLERIKKGLYINQKNYDIAKKSVYSLLEQKLKQKGIIYNIDFSNTVLVEIIIKKDDKRKFYILLAWNYFNAHPKEFSDFLDNPYVFNKYYFWCKELKIKEGEFEKSYQK